MQMETPPTRSVTKSVTIDRPAAEVHAFLADAANWPQWAIINVLAVEPGDEPGWWKLSTPDGPAEFRIHADTATGGSGWATAGPHGRVHASLSITAC